MENVFKIYIIKFYMSFSVSKDEVFTIVTTCQDRSYAEEIDLLKEHGSTPDWLVTGLRSDSHRGISNDVEDLNTRRDTFGSNQK